MVSKVKTILLSSGESVEFHRFTCDDLDNIADLYRSDFKANAVKSAKEEGWDNESIWRLKLSIDQKPIDMTTLYQAARSPKWIKVFLKKSLTLSGVLAEKQDEIIAQLNTEVRVDICQKLVFDLPEQPAVDDKSVVPLDSSGTATS